jgi:tectonin-like protein
MADIFRFENGTFVKKPGSLRQISVGNAQVVWGVNDDSSVFTWDGEAFQIVIGRPGHATPQLRLVRVAENGDAIWGIDTKGGLVFRSDKGFVPVQTDGPQEFQNVAPGSSSAWAITASATYLVEKDGIFKKFSLPLRVISCGDDSNAWAVNAQGEVFFFDVDRARFQKVEGITFSSVAAGASVPNPVQGGVQVFGLKPRDNPNSVIQEHDIFRAFLTGDLERPFAFTQIPHCELMTVSAGSKDAWGINALHEIFQFDPEAENRNGAFIKRDSRDQWISVAVGAGEVWALA